MATRALPVAQTPRSRTEHALYHTLVREFDRAGMPHVREDAIPVMIVDDAKPHWETISLFEGKHTGMFGGSQNGKGMTAQWMTLTALALGPERVEVVIIDMKRARDYVAFAPYLAHCRLYGAHSKADGSAEDGFAYVTAQMDARYDQMDTVYPPARNMREYNEHADVLRMRPLLVIVDEANALRGKLVRQLADLTERAAAAGITLVVVTTLPNAETLGTQTIFNLKNRIVFGINAGRYTNMVMGVGPGDEPTYDPAYIPFPVLRFCGANRAARSWAAPCCSMIVFASR